ncbi:MAG TPA: hypothetical protein VK668_20255 [Mucilaginibacter sp.]|nr:hypothetical protein [Mucilaginibacter sp.]
MEKLTPAQLTQLTLDYKNLGDQLMNYMNDNVNNLTTSQYLAMSHSVSIIHHNVTLLGALSTYETVQNLSAQIASINKASGKINAALKTIANVQKAINIAATVVNLGVSILTFNVNDIITNAGTLITQVS